MTYNKIFKKERKRLQIECIINELRCANDVEEIMIKKPIKKLHQEELNKNEMGQFLKNINGHNSSILKWIFEYLYNCLKKT